MAEALRPLMTPQGASRRSHGVFGVFPPITLILFLGPVLAGLAGVLLPAFGYFPALGGASFGLDPWRDLMATPGVLHAIALSLFTGFGATLVTVALAFAVVAAWHGTLVFANVRRLLAPLLAVPHAAFAIGFAFLAAPSGWIVRLLSPWATGWDRPPDIASVQDSYGFALMAALVCKEIFFLLLMILAALGQVQADKFLTAARGLGYGSVAAWCKVVLPLVYRQIRLPIYTVLAYGLSVVDMAMILGPGTPPTFAVLLLRWFQAPDLNFRFRAAAGALLLVVIVTAAIALWRGGEYLIARGARRGLSDGRRRFAEGPARWLSGVLMAVIMAITAGAMAVLLLWSVTGAWRFPAALPDDITLSPWTDAWPSLAGPLTVTAVIAVIATLVALVAVVGCLENELRHGITPTQKSLVLLYVPLLVPQVSFLSGLQILFVATDLDGSWTAVILCHVAFVLPYLFLMLSGPYRALDQRYFRAAATLGASPSRVFRQVRLPLVLKALLASLAVGFAVSVSQYLATLLPGVGRVSSITTEAVALAAGGDRRLTAVYGLVQMILPLLVFALAIAVPLYQSRQRRDLRAG